jgi:hypothetical protein
VLFLTAPFQGRIARIDAVSGMDVVVVFEQTSALEVRPFSRHLLMCLLFVAQRGLYSPAILRSFSN